MYCSNCGKKIDETAKYCLYCGAKLKTQTTINNSSVSIKTQKSTKNNITSASDKKELSFGPCLGGMVTIYFVSFLVSQLLNISYLSQNSAFFVGVEGIYICLFLILAGGCLSYLHTVEFSYNESTDLSELTDKELCLVSFLNGLFAGIFGLLFNYNKNRNKKCYSHFVIGCLYLLSLVVLIIVTWSQITFSIQDSGNNLSTHGPGLLIGVGSVGITLYWILEG